MFQGRAFEGAETNFTVLVTNFDEGFPEADENRVRKTLTGCERFFHVSFPPLDLNDAMQEEENREVRQEYRDSRKIFQTLDLLIQIALKGY